MIIHNYDRDTGEYVSSEEALINPENPQEPLIPAFATEKRLPIAKEGYTRKFNGKNWFYEEIKKQEIIQPEPIVLSYKEKRRAEYPELGDVIDALLKAERGDSQELDEIIALRNEIKRKYPKDE